MAQSTRRPLVGVLLFVVTALLAGSALSSPPWPGYGPYLGLPYNACGQVGRVVSQYLLGGLGVPVFLGLWSLVFLVAFRLLAGMPRVSWPFFSWFLLTAFVASVFLSSIGGTPVWGEGAGTVAGWLKSGARLGPLGSGLLTGGLLTWFIFLGASRWTPSPVQNRAGALAEGARGRMPSLSGAREGAAEAGERIRGLGDRVVEGFSWLDPRPLFRFRRSQNGDSAESATTAPAVDMTEEVAAALHRPPQRKLRDRGTSRRRQSPDFEPKKADVLEAVSPVGDYAEEEGAYEDGDEYVDGDVYEDEYVYEEAEGDEDGYEEDEGDVDEVELEDGAARVVGATEPLFAPRESGPPPVKKRPRKKKGVFPLPPLELLELPEARHGTVTREEVIQKSQILVKTLEDFGIQGRIGEVHPGPVITQYEYAPAAGVRISQIVSRTDDLALALKASRIRIVAPIPGKAAIGIEVPNAVAEHIDLRTVLGELDLSDSHLPLCLGRDIRGRAQYGRLEKMPHLLVAGTTGSGKSVCLNTCLFSLLYNKRPEDLRLLMIDPKMLELTVYDGIPHLLCPVVTDARMAARMLQWMVGEMERRYRKMATFGVRNIEGYHEKMKGKVEAEAEPMPYIVVIVDELADLMLTLGNEIETPIARLAQMARAVGIHLILATQRPSVDVITGVIKANFPGRIAFQVATKVDSRTIIDGNGAENLLGKGDMLYMPPGKGAPVRLHGAFVSDADAERLVEYLKGMPDPDPIFREEMLDKEADGAEIDDELFEDALRLVVYQKQASVSFLQRRLKVGYSRAGRLMDLLEGAGAVGPHEGSKPREVLADEGFLDSWVNRAPAPSE